MCFLLTKDSDINLGVLNRDYLWLEVFPEDFGKKIILAESGDDPFWYMEYIEFPDNAESWDDHSFYLWGKADIGAMGETISRAAGSRSQAVLIPNYYRIQYYVHRRLRHNKEVLFWAGYSEVNPRGGNGNHGPRGREVISSDASGTASACDSN